MATRQISGCWKQRSKGGKVYYTSAKITKEMIEVLQTIKEGEKFLIFPVEKGENENRPDINLTIGDAGDSNKAD